MRTTWKVRAATLAATAGLVAAAAAVTLPAEAAAAGCAVTYQVSSQWQSGFGATVTVANLGDPVNGWALTWTYAAGQQVTQYWNATVAQSGGQVRASNVSYNASIGSNATVSFGFNGSWTGSNPAPAAFALNGTTCTGGTSTPPPSTTPPPSSPPPSSPPPSSPPPSSPPPTGSLPSSFRWSSSGALIGPKNDGRGIAGIKDPSVVYHNGRYHVFASTAKSSGYNLVYTSFADWSQAGSAPFTYLDQTPIGAGYRAAPQVFYFAPQRLWYLVYQTGNASYSTNPDISNPAGWSAPKNFYGGMPQIISDNIGNGYWVDMWVICDSANCYLFSSDDNGHLYRSQTTLANFPNGMTNTVIAMQDSDRNRLFEASNVYRVGDQYLLLVEAIGSDGRRWFRSWTAPAITGPWTALADTESNPFARANTVSFPGGAWTRDISHGELIRSGYDQTLTVSPCNLRYLYQGLDPAAGGDYNGLPWRLGLLTQTNSTC
ncbi:cellulose binding domain-containing protein [Micromonospora sp. A3M-1-15]|uniref:non-reducing end alpha-L-arabinofuranosidase family hydrolase n=1 Tax=Micromonospora sp. A3M-1-15 TaxID=2962035 RepID=UPI0020B69984|nr:non-reducing end alpha-L-arabinofuranosidase family hydrolase [Micromonospora sp. A3M-1-15]MCP3786699.1 cellulose binding domain-containing protein [Micromonospora sp. A3M-1-15]